MTRNSRAVQPTQAGILLLPGFALTSFARATETFRTANRQADQTLYKCIQFNAGGEALNSSNGTTVLPHAAITHTDVPDMVFACARQLQC